MYYVEISFWFHSPLGVDWRLLMEHVVFSASEILMLVSLAVDTRFFSLLRDGLDLLELVRVVELCVPPKEEFLCLATMSRSRSTAADFRRTPA